MYHIGDKFACQTNHPRLRSLIKGKQYVVSGIQIHQVGGWGTVGHISFCDNQQFVVSLPLNEVPIYMKPSVVNNTSLF